MDTEREWLSVMDSAKKLSEMARTIEADVATHDRTVAGRALGKIMQEAEAAYTVLIGVPD